jgi:hypothetical protein
MVTGSIGVTEFKRNADVWPDRLQGQEALVLTLHGQGRVVLLNHERPTAWDEVSDRLDRQGAIANADVVRLEACPAPTNTPARAHKPPSLPPKPNSLRPIPRASTGSRSAQRLHTRAKVSPATEPAPRRAGPSATSSSPGRLACTRPNSTRA